MEGSLRIIAAKCQAFGTPKDPTTATDRREHLSDSSSEWLTHSTGVGLE